VKRILIANRGEIALRVIQTCRRLGVETVGIMASNELTPLHCREADFQIKLDGSSLGETYLSIDNIIKAAKDSYADAIHPGYGFLSENPLLAKACKQANITFIGPSEKTLESLGKKDLARAIAEKLKIPIVPGYSGKDQTPSLLKKKAKEIGFPVLLKASAGGGGRGMRRVDNENQIEAEIESAKKEAKSFFSDDELIIEKLIENPRHIEVQIIADAHGNVLHLFERDCSIQRRYQKVIEIAPAPGIEEEKLESLYKDAITICSECNLRGAATVEFLWTEKGHYFLEVNPRIQVEHPVTECITGLDIIELQIIVASGNELDLKQKDVKKNGSAIQARVYAEIPEREYLPGVGLLEDSNLPAIQDGFQLIDGTRFDFAVENFSHISAQFDPLIVKIICHDSNFEKSREKVQKTLENTALWGLGTNLGLLLSLIKELKLSNVENVKIEKILKDTDLKRLSMVALCLGIDFLDETKKEDSFFNKKFWREATNKKQDESNYVVSSPNMNKASILTLQECKKNKLEEKITPLNYRLLKDEAQREIIELTLNGYPFTVSRQNSNRILSDLQDESSKKTVESPLPGVVLKILKKSGDSASKGESLVILESMKIEHQIKAPRDCIIEKVHVAEGNNVKNEEILLSLEAKS